MRKRKRDRQSKIEKKNGTEREGERKNEIRRGGRDRERQKEEGKR